jgi:outer membrane protein TolC
MTWEVRNLGFGEAASRRAATSRMQQATFEKLQVMDQVAREVSESYDQVMLRGERITIAQRAIKVAENSYERNLGRIRDAQGLPLEALQSLQALESARRAYLTAVVDYNRAQFQLQWALGWPVSVSAESLAVALPPAVPPMPE